MAAPAARRGEMSIAIRPARNTRSPPIAKPQTLTARPLAASRLGPWIQVETDGVVYGPVSIEDDRFSAALRPRAGGGPFLVRYVGLEPLEGRESRQEREELEERLKALGYIE